MPSDDETTSTRLAGTGQHRPGGPSGGVDAIRPAGRISSGSG